MEQIQFNLKKKFQVSLRVFWTVWNTSLNSLVEIRSGSCKRSWETLNLDSANFFAYIRLIVNI